MIHVAPGTVIRSMLRADARGRHGIRRWDHYAWVMRHKRWAKVKISPDLINALATDPDIVKEIKTNRHEPAIVTAYRPDVLIAQDGNHRVLAAKRRGDRTVTVFMPTAHLRNVLRYLE